MMLPRYENIKIYGAMVAYLLQNKLEYLSEELFYLELARYYLKGTHFNPLSGEKGYKMLSKLIEKAPKQTYFFITYNLNFFYNLGIQSTSSDLETRKVKISILEIIANLEMCDEVSKKYIENARYELLNIIEELINDSSQGVIEISSAKKILEKLKEFKVDGAREVLEEACKVEGDSINNNTDTKIEGAQSCRLSVKSLIDALNANKVHFNERGCNPEPSIFNSQLEKIKPKEQSRQKQFLEMFPKEGKGLNKLSNSFSIY